MKTQEKKRICTFICGIEGGGAETVIQNYFSKIDRSKYYLDLVAYGVSNKQCMNKFKDLGFNIILIPQKKEGFLKSLMAMNKIIKKGNYSIIHAHLTEWNFLPMMFGYLHGVDIRISHAHTTKQIHSLKMNIVLFFQRILNSLFATKYCACGRASAEYLYPKRLISANKIIYIHNAIDMSKFYRNIDLRIQVRQELGINDDVFCLGHIGRFIPVKNHIFLIKVFAEITYLIPKSILILVGTGELEETIKSTVKQMQLTEKVMFLGSRTDVNRIYNAIDCFSLPSISEGLPLVCVEAQACCVPTVVSSTVSDEVLLTDYIQQISLNKSPKEWAQEIIDMSSNRSVCKFPDEYNLDKEAIKWENLYIS